MDKTYELFRGGCMTTIKIKDHSYDVIEFTVKKLMKDEDGREIVNSGYTCFFSEREFAQFFEPIIDDMKVRINHANSNGK